MEFEFCWDSNNIYIYFLSSRELRLVFILMPIRFEIEKIIEIRGPCFGAKKAKKKETRKMGLSGM